MGASAGAFLALLTAATDAPPVQAVVSLYGDGDVGDEAFRQPTTFRPGTTPMDETRLGHTSARANCPKVTSLGTTSLWSAAGRASGQRRWSVVRRDPAPWFLPSERS